MNFLKARPVYRIVTMKTYRSPRIEVRDDEVRAFYEEHQDEVPRQEPQVTIANILVVPQPDASVMDDMDARLERIDAALERGESFETVAREHSQGPNASRGGLVVLGLHHGAGSHHRVGRVLDVLCGGQLLL